MAKLKKVLFKITNPPITNEVINMPMLYKGAKNTAVIQTNEVLNCAVLDNAQAMIIAQNHPSGDLSLATVFCRETWEEVAHVYGRFEPTVLAGYVVRLAQYYNGAIIVPERNNHGHAFIAKVKDLLLETPGYERPLLYRSPFDGKDGWLSNSKYKTMAMDFTAQVLRDRAVKIRTEATILELATIEASTEKAVEGEYDDRAMTVVIGLAALKWPRQMDGGGYSLKY